MRRPELDYILSTMLDSQPEVSDLLFTVDKPLQVEALGESAEKIYAELTERDVEVCLKLPVLAMVPTVAPAGRHARADETARALGLAGTHT